MGISAESRSWPPGIELVLDRLQIDRDPTEMFPLIDGVRDVTSKVRHVCREFAPEIRALGFGPWRDKSGVKWGGLLYRALQSNDDRQMCLQYLYVVTTQIGIISLFWNFIVPGLLLLWSAGVYGIYCPLTIQPGNDWMFGCPWFAFLSISAACFPLLTLGLGPHLKDQRRLPIGSRLNLRPTSLLIFYSLLVMLLPFIGWIIVLPYIGVMIAQAFLYTMYKQRLMPSRPLNYIPVFIWLRREEDKAEWEFERASWEFHHQRSMMVTKDDAKEQFLHDGKRISLITDSGWNSMYIGSIQRTILARGNALIAASSLIILLPLILTGIYATSYVTLIAALVILPFFFVLSGHQVARWPLALFDFIDDSQEFDEAGAHLSEEKLRVLWNLPDDSRLQYKRKLQDPFIEDELFLTTFHDGLARLVIDQIDSPRDGLVRVIVYGYESQTEFGIRDDELDAELDVVERLYAIPIETILRFKDIKKLNEGDVYETYDATPLFQYLDVISKKEIPEYRQIPSQEMLLSMIEFRKIVKEVRARYKKHREAMQKQSRFKGSIIEDWEVGKEPKEGPDISKFFEGIDIIEYDESDTRDSPIQDGD